MHRYKHKNDLHTQGIIFHCLRTIRWLPLWLFSGVGAADTLLQLQHGQELHWLFLIICAISGYMLFQLGNVLCHQTRQPGQQTGRSKIAQQTEVATETPCRNIACAYRRLNRAARLMIVGAVVEAAFAEKRREFGETCLQRGKIQPRQAKIPHTRRINQQAA